MYNFKVLTSEIEEIKKLVKERWRQMTCDKQLREREMKRKKKRMISVRVREMRKTLRKLDNGKEKIKVERRRKQKRKVDRRWQEKRNEDR